MNEAKKEAYKLIDWGVELIKQGFDALDVENARLDPPPAPSEHERRDFSGDDQEIAELRRLSPAAKRFLAHHIKNTLHAVNLYCEAEQPNKARRSVWQLNDIVEQIIMEVNHGDDAGVETEAPAVFPANSARETGGQN